MRSDLSTFERTSCESQQFDQRIFFSHIRTLAFAPPWLPKSMSIKGNVPPYVHIARHTRIIEEGARSRSRQVMTIFALYSKEGGERRGGATLF